MNEIIFLTGYYRSGTSALAGALNHLGIKFKDNVPKDKFNPKGFYEVAELIRFDETVFQTYNMKWSDIRPFPNSWWLHQNMMQNVVNLRKILNRKILDAPICGIKHPHLCRLLPIYKEAAIGHKYYNVNITRNPWISNASQIHKNQLSRSHALILWLIHVIESELNSKDMVRSWIIYDELLLDSEKQFKKIGNDIGINFTDFSIAKESILNELNHNISLPKAGVSSSLVSLVDDVWNAVKTENFDKELWEDYRLACQDMTNFIIDMGKSLKSVAPGIGLSQ